METDFFETTKYLCTQQAAVLGQVVGLPSVIASTMLEVASDCDALIAKGSKRSDMPAVSNKLKAILDAYKRLPKTARDAFDLAQRTTGGPG